MNKFISQELSENLLKWVNLGNDGGLYFHPERAKSFFDSEIKQAAEEIRGIRNPYNVEDIYYTPFNEGREAAAKHLESLT